MSQGKEVGRMELSQHRSSFQAIWKTVPLDSLSLREGRNSYLLGIRGLTDNNHCTALVFLQLAN